MRNRNGEPVLPSRTLASGTTKRGLLSTASWIALIIISSCTSFYLGIWTAWSISPSSSDVDACLKAANGEDSGDLGRKIGDIFQNRLERAVNDKKCPEVKCTEPNNVPEREEKSGTSPRFNRSLSHFLNGAVTVNRQKLFDAFDFGVPISDNASYQNTLILYDSTRSLPSDATMKAAAQNNGEIPEMDALDAMANCDAMNVIFIKSPIELRQCYVLVGGQYQGYHVQRWMRIEGEGAHGKVVPTAPLHQVSRMVSGKGYDELTMPKAWHSKLHREIMLTYYTHLTEMQNELQSILKKIAIDNAVIVLTVNKGQSELLINWVCSARSKGFDLKNAIVFPTDQFSKDVADELGLSTFYHEELTKGIPDSEAARYGDSTFGHIMMAKVICVQLVNDLGYDLLFQDVDVIWYKNPFEYFKSPKANNFDVFFQDDGNRQERFAPYSANSGFYFARSNDRSKLLFRSMLNNGDLVFACRSHQQVLTAMLAEINNYAGLTVKVLNRDNDEFPSGYHYHMKKDWMRQWVDGKKDPYIFHMCWTLNKEDKLNFMKQMGMWYVHDKCPGKEVKEILGSNSKVGLIGECCSAEPLTQCVFKDKASVIPCKDSPSKDKGGASFWK